MTSSSTSPSHSVTFGQDSKFSCYLPLTNDELRQVCEAGATGVTPYFGSLSNRFGVWGSANFVNVNEWIAATIPTPPVGVRTADMDERYSGENRMNKC